MIRSMIVTALTLGLTVSLAACADQSSGTGLRSGSAYGYQYCRAGTCGDDSNPIAGTNANVGPGPIGEDWHKGPRE